MDPVSAIVGALIAGATVAAKETATQAVKDTYAGLKKVMIDLYSFASIVLLEKSPSNPSFQSAVREEVNASPQITNDVRILAQVKALNDALIKSPAERLEVWGVKSARSNQALTWFLSAYRD